MTESPPRPDLQQPEGADQPFMAPLAPLPVAPWWASSAPDPTPPEEPQEFLGTAAAAEPAVHVRIVPVDLRKAPSMAITTGPQPMVAPPGPVPVPPPAPPPLPPRSGRGRRGLLIFCLVFVVGMTAATVAGVVITMPGAQGPPLREVVASKTAGGLHRDTVPPEASASYPFIIAAARAGGVEEAITARGAYRGPVTNAQDVLFLGGTAPIGDPAAFLLRARPSTMLTVSENHLPDTGDAQVSCGTFAVLKATHPYCAWATENSFGFIASNRPTGQPATLAALTERMRADLETRVTSR